MPYGLVVRFTATDEAAAEAFDRLASDTLDEIKAREPSTLVYVSHVPIGEPTVRVFYELYADRAAFDLHEQQPHVVRFLADREQYLRATEVTFLDSVAGKHPAQER